MTEAAIDIIDCDLVEVVGDDSTAFLQGQVSQDVEALGVGDSAMSFVLQPSGHVDAWFRLHRTGPSSYTIEAEAGLGSLLTSRLQKFLIRTAADVGDPAPGRVLRIRGEAPGRWTSGDAPTGSMIAQVEWSELTGTDLVGPAGEIDQAALGLGVAQTRESGISAVEQLRVAAGVPRFGIDLVAGSIPASAGEAVIRASVSFTKGCYTGQELVARMNSRGGQAPVVLRRLSADGPLDVGSTAFVDGDEVGQVTSVAGSVGLAALMRKVAPGSSVDVSGTIARVEALPGDPLIEPT